MPEASGHCLCGSVSFAFAGDPNWVAHCHCESCRRATSSAFTTYVGIPSGQWRWTGTEPRSFTSSLGTRWLFCDACGTHLAYDSDDAPDEIHFFAALLDRPGDFLPMKHDHHEERLPWPNVVDTLPKLTG